MGLFVVGSGTQTFAGSATFNSAEPIRLTLDAFSPTDSGRAIVLSLPTSSPHQVVSGFDGDPCSLVTLDELTQATGVPVKLTGRAGAQVPEDPTYRSCIYGGGASADALLVTVSVTHTPAVVAGLRQNPTQNGACRPLTGISDVACVNETMVLADKGAYMLMLNVIFPGRNTAPPEQMLRDIAHSALARLP